MQQTVDKLKETKKTKVQKYFKCKNCGYTVIIANSYCPICAKEGKKIIMK